MSMFWLAAPTSPKMVSRFLMACGPGFSQVTIGRMTKRMNLTKGLESNKASLYNGVELLENKIFQIKSRILARVK